MVLQTLKLSYCIIYDVMSLAAARHFGIIRVRPVLQDRVRTASMLSMPCCFLLRCCLPGAYESFDIPHMPLMSYIQTAHWAIHKHACNKNPSFTLCGVPYFVEVPKASMTYAMIRKGLEKPYSFNLNLILLSIFTSCTARRNTIS